MQLNELKKAGLIHFCVSRICCFDERDFVIHIKFCAASQGSRARGARRPLSRPLSCLLSVLLLCAGYFPRLD